MKYRLVVITDGREGLLDRTLEAFFAKVTPEPTDVVIVDDSADADYQRYLYAIADDLSGTVDAGVSVLCHSERQGFCRTVNDGWARAGDLAGRRESVPWVYWLEDDFVHLRGTDLREIAFVMDREPNLVQMALYRNPVNPDEIKAGGYMNLRPETYERRGDGSTRWWEHRNFWTTNPSLFRTSFARSHRWLDDADERFCEGKFGIRLMARDDRVRFGVWGAGDVWVEHIGVRAGTGY